MPGHTYCTELLRRHLVAFAANFARWLDPEMALKWHLFCARHPLFFAADERDPQVLRTRLWGLPLSNPLGLSAGFDKNAESVDGLHLCGFGFVEVGTVTPLPQTGNQKPRITRLREDNALINRYNPSAGISEVAKALQGLARRRPFGVNVGPMAGTADAEANYVSGIRELGPLADYVCVNVSNPTVASDAVEGTAIGQLLRRLRKEVDALPPGPTGSVPPFVLKVGHDLSPVQREEVAREALAQRIDGLIVSNASLARPASLRSPTARAEAGGLSGAPLRDHALAALGDFYRLTEGKVPLIGSGGVRSGKDAYERIRAGASAVQVYTAFAYDGLGVLPRIKGELALLLEADGFSCVADAVGADHVSRSASARSKA